MSANFKLTQQEEFQALLQSFCEMRMFIHGFIHETYKDPYRLTMAYVDSFGGLTAGEIAQIQAQIKQTKDLTHAVREQVGQQSIKTLEAGSNHLKYLYLLRSQG